MVAREMIKAMILSLFMYLSNILSAFNSPRKANVAYNVQKSDQNNDFISQLKFYNDAELRNENSINAKFENKIITILPDIKKILSALRYHEFIVDLHHSEAVRFRGFGMKLDHNCAAVIVDLMIPFIMLKDKKQEIDEVCKDLECFIRDLKANFEKIRNQNAEKLSYSEREFEIIVEKYGKEIKNGTFNWDAFVYSHYDHVSSIIICNINRNKVEHIRFCTQLALLLRITVAKNFLSFITTKIAKYNEKDMWRTTYIWFGSQIRSDQAQKIMDAANAENKKLLCYEVLDRFYDSVYEIMYSFDSKSNFMIKAFRRWRDGKAKYSYTSDLNQKTDLEHFFGFIHIYNSKNLKYLYDQRVKSYTDQYKIAGAAIDREVKDKIEEINKKDENKLQQYTNERNALVKKLVAQKAKAQDLQKQIEEKRKEIQGCYPRQRIFRYKSRYNNI
ncbi:hypothetical protein THOM_2248 [Trachipleistophora hominis]|uniref:Uncharacterized protein n=1 Tax=Trachipleistophora hominis TaxID=72359 RepID=L7JUU8_TRAHO|nr:hypothetical protein THOM_2248 [Trachipleistophora hominis]